MFLGTLKNNNESTENRIAQDVIVLEILFDY